MFCGRCGAQLREGDKFCGKCRAPVSTAHPAASPNPPNAVPQGTASPAEEPGTPRPPRRRNWWKAAAAVAVLFFLAVIGILYQRSRAKAPMLALAGPVVEMPPAMLFRGEQRLQSTSPSSAEVAQAEREFRLHPNDPKTLNDAGVVIAAAGDSERGMALLEQAHQAAPQDPTIAYNYARALYQQGKTDDAIKMARTAVQQQPQFDNAHLLLAAAATQKQDYTTAQQQLQQVQKQFQELTLLIQGAIQLAHHQPQQALQSFQQAAQLASNDPTALYDEGLGYQMNQNLGQAQPLYQSALKLNPNLRAAHQNLGTVLMQNGNTRAANAEFQTAAALQSPSNSSLSPILPAAVPSARGLPITGGNSNSQSAQTLASAASPASSAPMKCPSVKPANPLEAQLMSAAGRVVGCWERDASGHLVFVSPNAPNASLAGLGSQQAAQSQLPQPTQATSQAPRANSLKSYTQIIGAWEGTYTCGLKVATLELTTYGPSLHASLTVWGYPADNPNNTPAPPSTYTPPVSQATNTCGGVDPSDFDNGEPQKVPVETAVFDGRVLTLQIPAHKAYDSPDAPMVPPSNMRVSFLGNKMVAQDQKQSEETVIFRRVR